MNSAPLCGRFKAAGNCQLAECRWQNAAGRMPLAECRWQNAAGRMPKASSEVIPASGWIDWPYGKFLGKLH
jgi:hypothetical protein